MADGPQPQREFEVDLATLGKLTCRRLTIGAFMRVLREIGDDPEPEPQKAVRALLCAIAKKPDGTEPTPTESAAVPEAEIEAFAARMLDFDEDLRPEGWAHGEPATAALAKGLKLRETKLAGRTGGSVYAATLGMAALKDNITAAARAVGASSTPRPKFSGAPRVDIERLAAIAAPPKPRPAETALRHIEERREAFAANLPEDREVAMVVASAPGGACFYIAEMEAITAELISFRGLDDDGEAVEVVQNASQCNVMFLPIRKAVARRPIGFTLGAA